MLPLELVPGWIPMHIFFSVGEPSGDLHAAKLVADLRRRVPDVRCTGFGGPQMEGAGCQLLHRLTDLAVMGILDVIPLLGRFAVLLWQARRWLSENRPDAVVLVDFPGFNWWVARLAKRRGIPVFYYMPPQLWAWAPWRIRKMRKFVDQVLCGLPFEQQWYHDRGMPARLVGHPFFDEAAERQLDGDFLCEQAASEPGTQTIGILPGSRNYEIQMNFDVQLQAMRALCERHPRVRFLVACYREEHRRQCEQRLRDAGLDLPIRFFVGRTAEIIELADMCLMVSGSVSLELLARHTPAVVIYRVGRLHHWIGQLVITCPYITLTNLIAGKPLMPEFVIPDAIDEPVAQITGILSGWLNDAVSRDAVVGELRQLSARVAVPGATRRCAEAVLEALAGRNAVDSRAAA